MNTKKIELNIDDLEMVNGGDLAKTLLHVAGGVTAMVVGSIAGPAGAIAAGLTFVAAEIAADKLT